MYNDINNEIKSMLLKIQVYFQIKLRPSSHKVKYNQTGYILFLLLDAGESNMELEAVYKIQLYFDILKELKHCFLIQYNFGINLEKFQFKLYYYSNYFNFNLCINKHVNLELGNHILL